MYYKLPWVDRVILTSERNLTTTHIFLVFNKVEICRKCLSAPLQSLLYNIPQKSHHTYHHSQCIWTVLSEMKYYVDMISTFWMDNNNQQLTKDSSHSSHILIFKVLLVRFSKKLQSPYCNPPPSYPTYLDLYSEKIG